MSGPVYLALLPIVRNERRGLLCSVNANRDARYDLSVVDQLNVLAIHHQPLLLDVVLVIATAVIDGFICTLMDHLMRDAI